MSNINNTKERRGGRSMCGYGIRADSGGYQSSGRRGKNE